MQLEHVSKEPFPVCYDQPPWQSCQCQDPVRGYVDGRLASIERRGLGKTRRRLNIVGGLKMKKPLDCQRLFEKILEVHELHVWRLAGDRIVASAHIHCQTAADYVQIAGDVKKFFHNAGVHSTTIQPEFVEDDQGIFQTEDENSPFNQRYHESAVTTENGFNANSETSETIIPQRTALGQTVSVDGSSPYIDDCQLPPSNHLPPSTVKRLTSNGDSDSGYCSGTTSPAIDSSARQALPEDHLDLQHQHRLPLERIAEQQQQTNHSEPWSVTAEDIPPIQSSNVVSFSPDNNGVISRQRTQHRRSSFQFPFFNRRRNRRTSGSGKASSSELQRNLVNGENRENWQPDGNGSSYRKLSLATTDAGKPVVDWRPTAANDRLLEWKNNVGSAVCINKTTYITDTGEFIYGGRREISSSVAKNKQLTPQEAAAKAKSDRKNLTGRVAANYLKQLSHHLPPEDYQVFGYVKQGDTIKPLVHRSNSVGCTRVGGDLEACAIQCDGATVAYHRWRGVQGYLLPPSSDPWGGIDISEHFLAQLPPMPTSPDD